MKLKQLPLEYQKAIPVLKKLENAGYEAYFVGGSVRDILQQAHFQKKSNSFFQKR